MGGGGWGVGGRAMMCVLTAMGHIGADRVTKWPKSSDNIGTHITNYHLIIGVLIYISWRIGTFSYCYEYSVAKHLLVLLHHYNDTITSAMASQITGVLTVYSTFVQAQIKENIKAPRYYWPLWGWIPRTKGQWRGKWFHLMTSSWVKHWHYDLLLLHPDI